MRTILLIIFTCYFSIEFCGALSAWINTKDKRKYWWHFINTIISAGMMFAFVKLIEVLSK